MLQQIAIALKNITIGYGNTIILKDLSLGIKKGEFVSILGENGVGKTTLFKGILQLLPCSEGHIEIFDVDITKKADKTWLRSQIGYVPQVHGKGNFPISVFDAVLLGRWGMSFSYFKRPSQKDREATSEILEMVDLHHMKDQDCRRLSGGQTQRLNIARALVRKPSILLLDEPTTHLDIASQHKLDKTISHIRNQYHLSILMISHDQAHAREISDRVVYLRNGRLFHDLGVAI